MSTIKGPSQPLFLMPSKLLLVIPVICMVKQNLNHALLRTTWININLWIKIVIDYNKVIIIR